MTIEEIYNTIKEFIPVYVICFLTFEFIVNYTLTKRLTLKEFKLNILSGLIVLITQTVLQISLLANLYPFLYENRILEINSVGLSVFLGILLYTFLQYLTHILSHRVRIFWCLHEVHHSATEMNSSAGLRNSIFEIISTDIFYLVIPLLGIHPLIYLTIYSVAKIWGTFIHINENIIDEIPILNKIIVDPKTHHLHHARNRIYTDKNYCETFCIYDKLFGTYIEETEKPIYGSSSNPEPRGFWSIHTFEFKRLIKDIRTVKSVKDKVRYVLYPPDWTPNK